MCYGTPRTQWAAVWWWWWWRRRSSIIKAHYAERLYCATCSGVLSRGKSIFSADLKEPELSDGSRRWSGKKFQTLGPAMGKARRPNLLLPAVWFELRWRAEFVQFVNDALDGIAVRWQMARAMKHGLGSPIRAQVSYFQHFFDSRSRNFVWPTFWCINDGSFTSCGGTTCRCRLFLR